MLKYVDTKVTFSEVPDEISLCIRVIGYLRPIKSFGKDRQIEASKRVYNKNI